MTDDVGSVRGDLRPEWSFEPGASPEEHATRDNIERVGAYAGFVLSALRREIAGWQKLTTHHFTIPRRLR